MTSWLPKSRKARRRLMVVAVAGANSALRRLLYRGLDLRDSRRAARTRVIEPGLAPAAPQERTS